MEKHFTSVSQTDLLDNCENEAIHIPGSIQPHGALLAFLPDGSLAATSKDAWLLTGDLPPIGSPLGEQHLDSRVRAAIHSKLTDTHQFSQSLSIEVKGSILDLIMHKSDGLLVVELEKRMQNSPPLDEYAHMAQHVIDHLHHATGISDMLQIAADEIRRLTGFDRVMAYRFLYDDSGEVVAESRRAEMDTLLGQRFPASDIPAQARRLYVINPIRLIADVAYDALPIWPDNNPLTNKSIDLSHSVLRSVSPIHVTYLKNMGVSASMSISIIVQGRLWGMLGCHHESARLVPHAVRLSCVVLSRIVSAMAERFEAEAYARTIEETANLRQHIIDTADEAKELHLAFHNSQDEIIRLVRADGCALVVEGKLVVAGNTPSREDIVQLIDWLLSNRDEDIFQTNNLEHDAASLTSKMEPICGVMAIRFDREQNGYLLWFRKEQVESVHWAGEPVKNYEDGPFGRRLTPRGSFSVWKQEVRGRSVPWSSGQIEIAKRLRTEFQEIAFSKSTRLRLDRERLWATLGHDMRAPLQAIMVCAARLTMNAENAHTTKMADRITAASQRMSRLVSDVMDISKLQSGMELRMNLRQIDCNVLISEMVAEMRLAFPDSQLEFEAKGDGTVLADADRFSQVITNLVGNAIHHGDKGRLISISSVATEKKLEIKVSNFAQPLNATFLADIFSPFKFSEHTDERNKDGLGLGLHIAKEIVKGHAGTMSVSQDEGTITFAVQLPKSEI